MGIITREKNNTNAVKYTTFYRTVFYLSISRPRQGRALWRLSFAVCADHFLSQLIYNNLALQILQGDNKGNQ